ncbi:hypothetical protein NON20_05475 [Synechocystis sp. B12]|nr:hypothetical protein NON20_05475 [Synechocystis sp. B12]
MKINRQGQAKVLTEQELHNLFTVGLLTPAIACCLAFVFILVAVLGKPVHWPGMMSPPMP